MKKATRFVGLDVHAETIAIAVAEPGRGGEVRSLGTIPNRAEAVRKLVHKLCGAKNIQVCYEAGPTGYTLYWQLTAMGVERSTMSPSGSGVSSRPSTTRSRPCRRSYAPSSTDCRHCVASRS